MTSFEKSWAHREVKSMTEKIRDTVKPQGALKPRIQTAVNKLQVQTSKMDVMLTKLHERDPNPESNTMIFATNSSKSFRFLLFVS